MYYQRCCKGFGHPFWKGTKHACYSQRQRGLQTCLDEHSELANCPRSRKGCDIGLCALQGSWVGAPNNITSHGMAVAAGSAGGAPQVQAFDGPPEGSAAPGVSPSSPSASSSSPSSSSTSPPSSPSPGSSTSSSPLPSSSPGSSG